jgi:PAS domain S-box-containing protein
MSDFIISEIATAWSDYIEKGLEPKKINKMIFNSWKRCKKYGVDPYGGCGTKVDPDILAESVEKNKDLIEISKPIMDNLHSIVQGTGFLLVLTDCTGLILHLIGEEGIRISAEKLKFSPGSLWSEEAVGTNAIGTCIKEDKPIQTIGAEHFCIGHHPWTCSAAPIHDSEGRLIGVLDMSGYSIGAHKHTLGIVVAAAYSIENQLSLWKSYALIDATFESIWDGIMLVDKEYSITRMNKAGERILGFARAEAYGQDIRMILGDKIFLSPDYYQRRIDWNFHINGKRIPCNIRVAPIAVHNSFNGLIIMFKEMKELHRTANVVAGNKAIYTFDNIMTRNSAMKTSIKEAQKFAKTRGCVLIEGESGTGKELFAHAIHNSSNRKDGPFVAINCASLPRDLVESELFGYERGAFTGAVREGKIGKFELANGGTLFMDEIGELPLDVQAKLLRVLDDYTITRVGGKVPIKLDVRVVVATNRNLLEEVKYKNFREDLYYRLNVFKVNIPPLRSRLEDLEPLADHFLKRLNAGNGTNKNFSLDFISGLMEHTWKGNVRELENLVERAYHLTEGETILISQLRKENDLHIVTQGGFETLTMKQHEKSAIEGVLEQTGGQVIEACSILGLSKSALYRKLKEYRIEPREYRS